MEYPGLDPERILDWSPTVFESVLMVHKFRVDEAQRASRKGR